MRAGAAQAGQTSQWHGRYKRQTGPRNLFPTTHMHIHHTSMSHRLASPARMVFPRIWNSSILGPARPYFRTVLVFSHRDRKGIVMATRPHIDFWFEFASTYSYLASQRIGTLAAEMGVDVRWRPFLLGPIFATNGWNNSPFNLFPAKGKNMWRDMERMCADMGLPLKRPDPFPQNTLTAARIAIAGRDAGWLPAFAAALFRAEFGEGKNIAEEAVLLATLRSVDIDPGPALALARSEDVKNKLKAETEYAKSIGIFGAPTFITSDGELFWGNDRLEQALAWAKNNAGQ